MAWEIEERRNLASSVPVAIRIVPIHENHTDARTSPIPETHVNAGTVHDQKNMPTVVRIPRRSGSLTTLLWT